MAESEGSVRQESELIEKSSNEKNKQNTKSAKFRAKLAWISVSTLILPAIDEGTDIWSSINHFM